jgi:DNA-binding NarL/FixJ family response regulator
MSIRILIADDHGLMRAGLRSILEDEPTIEVVGEAANGEEALYLAGQLAPNIVILDIEMPGADGIEATRRLKKMSPLIQVLILSVYEEESLLREALKAGASGYLIKRAVEEDLLTAINSVSRGDMYIHPGVTRLLVKELSPDTRPVKSEVEPLTAREVEVMGYIIRGFTNRQTAEVLSISIRTVEGHRASIFGKLGIKNRVELIEYAEKHGMIQ